MIQPVGYFKVWRELFLKPIWLNSTPEQKSILLTLMAMANFRKNKWEWMGKPFECIPGQFITSVNSIIKCCGDGVTRQNTRTALARFEKLEFLTIESTKTGMLITILNWHLYQGDDDCINQPPNQDLTIIQPRPNHQLTTIEEGKEGKKEKKVRSNIFVPPTIEEVRAYFQERQNSVNPQKWYAHYTSNGWKVGKNPMKNWKAAVITWEHDNKPPDKPKPTSGNPFKQRLKESQNEQG